MPRFLVEGGENFLHVHGSVIGLATILCRAADYLPGAHAAAGKYGGGHIWPLVAAAFLVYFWCATEFTPNNH